MRRWVLLVCALTAGLVFTGSAVGVSKHGLDLYTTTVDAATAGELARDGYDIAAAEAVTAGIQLDLVLSRSERATLAEEGITVKLERDKNGQSASQRALAQAAYGYDVWRSWDEPGGIRDEMYRLAAENPQILKLEVIGHTLQGREILALKMTQGARGIADGARPAVHVHVEHPRPRVDGARDEPAPAQLVRRRLALQQPQRAQVAPDARALVRALGQPGRVPVHVRRRAPLAEEPSRQRRRRHDHGRRRRRPQPQLRRRSGTGTTRARPRSWRARPTAAPRLPPSRRRRRRRTSSRGSGSSSCSRTTPTGPSSSIRTAGRSRLRPRTIRSTSPTRARTRSRPSPDSTPASRPTST